MNSRHLIILFLSLVLTNCFTSYRSTMDFLIAADSTARTRVMAATKALTTRFGLQPDTSASVPPVIWGYSGDSDHYFMLQLRDSSNGQFLAISFRHFAFIRSVSTRTYEPEEAFADTIRAIFGSRVLQSNLIRTP